ncbi:hypothetical protein N0V90_007587 [Kalmusia sp. IMI 367209]|nr:hypothetical protein N0V90_007587 [Kalmusia sp. IMI 367209]
MQSLFNCFIRLVSWNGGYERILGDDDTSNTHYSPLDPAQKEIRLLEIIATKPKIVCKLQTIPLFDNTVYSALSYVWGDATKTERIIVNSESISVTVSLARALRSVHYQWTTADGSKKHTMLWVDAICINQHDAREKNHQIPLMSMIYGNATSVLVCLGTSSPKKNFRKCFEAVNAISSAAKIYEQLPDWEKRTYLREWLRKVDSKAFFYGLNALNNDGYWRRVWTYQEIAIGRHVEFITAKGGISLERLTIAEEFIKSCNANMPYANRSYQVKEWVTDIYYEMGIIDQTNKARESFKQFRQEGSQDPSIRNEVLVHRLLQCCHHAITRQATDPKDYVYGYAALLDSAIEPDYSPSKTTAAVYCDLAEQILVLSGSTSLAFLDYAGIGYEWELPPGLPSWAPNLSGVSDNHFSTKICPRLALGHPPPMLVRASESLHCTAAILDSIADIGPCLSEGKGKSSTAWLVDWLLSILLHAYANGLPTYAKLIAVVDAISFTSLHTFSSRFGSPSSHAKHSVNKHDYLQLVAALMSRWEKRFPDNKKEKVGFLRSLLPTLEDQRKYDRRYIYDGAEDLRSWYTKFIRRTRSATLRIAQTTEGHMGLFPPVIKTGDDVAILDGFSNPVIVRRVGGCYVFVQVCYITEYQKDRASLLVSDKTVGWETIEIR